MTDPVLSPGERIRCVGARDIRELTEGKVYEVLKYEPRTPDQCFTWPAYVHIINDDGAAYCCHASRFVSEEQST